jgi:hypothetical protein
MNRMLLAVFLLSCGPAPEGAANQPTLPVQERLPGADAGTPAAAQDGGSAVDAGSPAPVDQFVYPTWEREDVQPQSRRFGQVYGLEAYRGRAVVVVLLEGFCTFCQGNVVIAEQLQTQLKAERRDIDVVVLGDANADEFVRRTALPLFRDGTPGRQAWQAMRSGASKHDTFVFAPNGERTFFWAGSYTGDANRWTTEVGAAARAVAPARP